MEEFNHIPAEIEAEKKINILLTSKSNYIYEREYHLHSDQPICSSQMSMRSQHKRFSDRCERTRAERVQSWLRADEFVYTKPCSLKWYMFQIISKRYFCVNLEWKCPIFNFFLQKSSILNLICEEMVGDGKLKSLTDKQYIVDMLCAQFHFSYLYIVQDVQIWTFFNINFFRQL